MASVFPDLIEIEEFRIRIGIAKMIELRFDFGISRIIAPLFDIVIDMIMIDLQGNQAVEPPGVIDAVIDRVLSSLTDPVHVKCGES
ncbi:MAG: hypothetical protein IKE16_00870 [Solobacterium sp.]|nr:hypothetical protein [Solobacterium sp.]